MNKKCILIILMFIKNCYIANTENWADTLLIKSLENTGKTALGVYLFATKLTDVKDLLSTLSNNRNHESSKKDIFSLLFPHEYSIKEYKNLITETITNYLLYLSLLFLCSEKTKTKAIDFLKK